MRNNKGPRVEPWGTPQVMFNLDDSNPLMETNCFLLLKKGLIKCRDLLLKSIIILFIVTNLVIYSIKCFLQLYEDSISYVTSCHIWFNTFCKIYRLHDYFSVLSGNQTGDHKSNYFQSRRNTYVCTQPFQSRRNTYVCTQPFQSRRNTYVCTQPFQSRRNTYVYTQPFQRSYWKLVIRILVYNFHKVIHFLFLNNGKTLAILHKSERFQLQKIS